MTAPSVHRRRRHSLVLAALFVLALAVPGNAIAQIDPFGLGDRDWGIKKGDLSSGFKTYITATVKAAEKGDAEAQYTLGSMYEFWSSVNALMWYSLSADAFAEKAQRAVAERTRNRLATVENARNRLAAKMTPADVSKAQRLAREWLAEHSK